MRRIHKAVAAFARFSVDDRGATAIEYAIVATGISVAVVGAVSLVGQELVTNIYNKVLEAFPT